MIFLPAHTPAQWFLFHEEDGALRDVPLESGLLGEEGLGRATLFMMWCAKNFPGYEAKKGKTAEVLVSTTGLPTRDAGVLLVG